MKKSENKKQNSRFSEKLFDFFSPEPQKERVLRHEDFDAAGDTYYATVSAGYKVAQRLLWLLFVLFVVISIAVNHTEITYDNFFYMLRDFSSAVDAESTNYEMLSYESDSRQRFALYRGGLATASPSAISVFTATGRRTLRLESSFSAPYIISSDKYMLVYDTAGTTFSVYNSFSRIYTETLTYPITNACFADDGTFAILTREADSKAVVYVYGKNFKKLAKCRLDAYMFDISIDSDRNLISFVLYDIGNGTGQTTVSVRELDTLEEIHSFVADGEFPIESSFVGKKKFALITDSAVRIIDENFDAENSEVYDYSTGNVTGYCINDYGIAVSYTVSSMNEIVAFDFEGKQIFNDAVHTGITDVALFERYIFVQTEGSVLRINSENADEQVLKSGSGKMLVYNNETVLVCGESKAEYLVFSGK